MLEERKTIKFFFLQQENLVDMCKIMYVLLNNVVSNFYNYRSRSLSVTEKEKSQEMNELIYIPL